MYSFMLLLYIFSYVPMLYVQSKHTFYVPMCTLLFQNTQEKSLFLPRKKFYSIYRRKFFKEPTHIYKTHPIYKKKEPRRGSISLLERNKFISIESANRLVSSCFHFINVNLNHCTACWHSDNINHFTTNTQLFSNSETN